MRPTSSAAAIPETTAVIIALTVLCGATVAAIGSTGMLMWVLGL